MNSHCQLLGFTFYCIVNAGIFFVYYVYDYYIYVYLCTCLVLWDSFVFLHRCVIYESVNRHVCIF